VKLCTVGWHYVTVSEAVYIIRELLSRHVFLSHIFIKLCYIDCIIVIIRHPDDGHRINGNIMVKNNVCGRTYL